MEVSLTFALLQCIFWHVLSGATLAQDLSAFSVSTTRSVLVGRQVSLDPPDATCGARGTERNISGVICLSDCPRKHPRDMYPYRPVPDPTTLGSTNCTLSNMSSELGDPSNSDQPKQEACFLSFERMPRMVETFTFWVKPEQPRGTIIHLQHEIFQGVEVYLTPSNHGLDPTLTFKALNVTKTLEAGRVPLDAWTHVTLQLFVSDYFYDNYAMLMVNGHISQPHIFVVDQQRRPANPVVYMGITASDTDTMFHGMVNDVRYYEQALTEREVVAEMFGELPEVAPRDECLCPEGYPEVDPDNTLICRGRVHRVAPRCGSSTKQNVLNKLLYLPTAINDQQFAGGKYFPDTTWLAEPGVDPVVVTIEMGEPVLIYNVTVQRKVKVAGSELTFALRRGSEWHDIYHVTSCTSRDMTSEGALAYNGIGCLDAQLIRRYFSIGLLWNRELVDDAYPDYVIHPYVREFLTGDALRLTIHGSTDPTGPVHNLVNLEATGWLANETECKCFSGATRRDGGVFPVCEGAKCQCLPGQGSPADSQHTCFPYVAVIEPNFGPASGGTKITIIGGYLGNTTAILTHTASVPLEVVYSSYTYIIAESPDVRALGSAALEAPSGFEITLYNGSSEQYVLKTRQKFTFKEDPVIESIEPRSTFLRGGINQTVVGRHLDSVYKPYMTVTIVYMHSQKYEQKQSPCEALNNTHMICQTPSIRHLPNGMWKEGGKLEASGGRIDRPDFRFYLGFRLDGVERYRNVSEVLPSYGAMHVYNNPSVSLFEEGNYIRPFYAYRGDSGLTIKGEGLSGGCQKKDYLIQVGRGVCNISELYSNIITCQPPVNKPRSSGGRPAVLVIVGNIRDFVGYLDYYAKPFDDPDVYTPVTVVIVVVVMATVAIMIVVCWKRYKKKNRRKLRHNYYGLQHEMTSCLNGQDVDRMPRTDGRPDLWDDLPVDLRTELDPCLRNRDRLRVGQEIGTGNFGSVYVGEYMEGVNDTTVVAVKTIKDHNATEKEWCEFLEEATLMKDFNHVHVLNLVGVVLKEGRPFVLLPLMENGDLRNFVLNPNNTFTVRDLLQYALQVAQGMEYLAGLKFVHRDLAARNCMVSARNVIKIADFGLARDICSSDYYRSKSNRPVPWRWMAPEALSEQLFTTSNDVWSYGVLVWETLTRGKKPYSGIDNEELEAYLLSGHRLARPTSAPQEIYSVLQQCWSHSADARPTFDWIVRQFNAFMARADEGTATSLSSYVPHTTDRHHSQSTMTPHEGYVNLELIHGALSDLHRSSIAAPSSECIGVADDVECVAPSSACIAAAHDTKYVAPSCECVPVANDKKCLAPSSDCVAVANDTECVAPSAANVYKTPIPLDRTKQTKTDLATGYKNPRTSDNSMQ